MPVVIQSTGPRGLHELRERNRMRVIEALRSDERLTQAGISRMTGLSRTTVSAIVTELKQQGLIRPAEVIQSGARGGRPGIGLQLRPHVESASELVGSPGESIDERRKLLAENAGLRSILASIQQLLAGRVGADSLTS